MKPRRNTRPPPNTCPHQSGAGYSGIRFYEEIERLMVEVRTRPTLYRRHIGEIRRHFSTEFPHGVLYHNRSDHVWILAVIPMRRAPDYWLHRL